MHDAHAEPLLLELGLETLETRRVNHVLDILDRIGSSHCHSSLLSLADQSESNELFVTDSRTLIGKRRFRVFAANAFNSQL